MEHRMSSWSSDRSASVYWKTRVHIPAKAISIQCVMVLDETLTVLHSAFGHIHNFKGEKLITYQQPTYASFIQFQESMSSSTTGRFLQNFGAKTPSLQKTQYSPVTLMAPDICHNLTQSKLWVQVGIANFPITYWCRAHLHLNIIIYFPFATHTYQELFLSVSSFSFFADKWPVVARWVAG
jgi:hypothetical protein